MYAVLLTITKYREYNMDALKTLGGYVLGFTIFIGAIITLALIFAFGAKIAFTIEPFISWLAGIIFIINLIVLLVAIVPKARGVAGMIVYYSSYIYGLSTWIYGLAITLAFWGWIAVIIGILLGGVGVVPIGMLASIFNGRWDIFWILFLNLALTYGTRIIGTLLISSYDNEVQNNDYNDIIELEPAAVKRTWDDVE